ncbi:hypothetical protein SEA_DUSTYDINO_102 [Microbacterium phage DustyDino]|nr:hypothetical protein SEA_DUSTYDINO_102 [Microbacterium phage DustyDino]UVK62512.1 hypothetical protein SEA_YUMA_97 [Microbacterium phage Yuma]
MSVEYWDRQREEWRRSYGVPADEVESINDTVGWEMYREVE